MNKNISGNAMMYGLAALVVVAIGALIFLSTRMDTEEKAVMEAETASSAAADPADRQSAPALAIEPGNPVVATIGKEEINRLDVINFIQTLPPEARQMPVDKLFPLALEQVINNKIIERKTSGVKLDNDPEVKRQLAQAKEQITRSVYIQNEVEKKLTDARLKEAYDDYVANFPEVEEVRARHILVKTEGEAGEMIRQLDAGASFEDLAKKHSTDATAANGGDLGYFLKTDVVPDFGEAAFGLAPGSYTQKPVKSEFGYHIILVEDKRPRAPLDFEKAKPFLGAQMQRAVLEELVRDWRDAAKVETFDINGKPVAPAADDAAEDPGKKS